MRRMNGWFRRSATAGARSLVRHFRDTLRDGTRRAQGHVRLTQSPGHDGAAVAHVSVIGVCRAARATTRTPVAGNSSAPGLHRGADGRIELVQRLGGRCRYPLPPLSERGRSSLPGGGELPSRVICVTGHKRIFSPGGGYGQPSGGFPASCGRCAARPAGTQGTGVEDERTARASEANMRIGVKVRTLAAVIAVIAVAAAGGCSAAPVASHSHAGGGLAGYWTRSVLLAARPWREPGYRLGGRPRRIRPG